MTAAFESDLLTPEQTGARSCKSAAAVRRLVKLGKLTALKEGGRLLIKAESVDAYISRLPHPVQVMAAMHDAQNTLGAALRFQRASRLYGWAHGAYSARGSLERHYFPAALPVCRQVLAAVKVKDYAQVCEQADELWRIRSDYQMLHAPIEVEQPLLLPKQRAQRPPAEQPSLFGGSP